MGSVYFTALSGLQACASAINTTGNNLANLDTIGFKGQSDQFNDLVANELDMSGQSAALGTARPLNVTEFLQGGIQSAASPLDAAVSGNGFFVTSGANGPLYTRDGEFQIGQDSAGNTVLLSSSGNPLEGYSIAQNGTASATVGNIVLPVSRAPVATSQLTLSANLNSQTAAGAGTEFDQSIYDAQGAQHTLGLVFTRGNTPGTWVMSAKEDGQLLPTQTTLQFDANGSLTSSSAVAIEANGQNITLPLSGAITQYGAPSSTSTFGADGAPAAAVNGYSIANGGVVYAQCSDGQQMPVAKLAVAGIQNPDSMIEVGSGNYRVTQNTMGYAALSAANGASPYFGDAASMGTQILGSSVEQSNANMATELTNLITYQYAYSANAKALTTADQMSQVLNQLVQ